MLPALLCVTLLMSVTAGCSDQNNRPLVATREGLVRGAIARSAAGHPFYSFKGIRYARPPLGSLRFQPPQRHPGWSGAAEATKHGHKCTQYIAFSEKPFSGEEDCLFSNVYTRQLPVQRGARGGLPVMVFIHGGAFVTGSGNDDYYGPSYLMDENVVLVTFNYRLGPFGFFTTHDSKAPGNYGLLDQVLLLQWVQDNIASFGGDPNTVTIFGESAGGASVSILVLSPLTKGLFHRAISQSGTAIANFAASGRQTGSAEEVAKQLDCYPHDVGEMVDCIRDVSSQALFKAANPKEQLFQPRVDREAESPLLPDDPRLLLERGDFNLVPWMNGNTEEEGWFFVPVVAANATILSGIFSGNLIAWSLMADLTTKSTSSILDCGANPMEETAKVKHFYAGMGAGATSLLPIARVISDRFFTAPTSVETILASRHTAVYKYVFDYKGPGRLSWGDLSVFNVTNSDPSHGDDLMYLFSNAKLPIAPCDSPTYTMIRFMVSLWTSFARTGRPSSDALAMPDWPVFTEQSQRHMHLNSEPTLGERLFEKRVNFWQTVRINEPWRHKVRTACMASRLGGDREVQELGLYSILLLHFG